MNNDLKNWAARWNIPAMAMAEFAAIVTPQRSNYVTDDNQSETATQQRIRVMAAGAGYAMWRNNNGAFKNPAGQSVRFGLGNDSKKLNKVWKSPDLVGIGPDGKFVGCEVKDPEWCGVTNEHEQGQENCLNQINALGGIGFFATHPNDYQLKVLS